MFVEFTPIVVADTKTIYGYNWEAPLNISSVNVTKLVVSSGLAHIYWKKHYKKTFNGQKLETGNGWKLLLRLTHRAVSGPYFPAFGLNSKIYSVNFCIHSEYRKTRARNNSVFEHFSRSIIRNTIKNSVIQVIDETGDLIVGYFLFQN